MNGAARDGASRRPEGVVNSYRVGYINGFKGIAALMVMSGHFLIAFYPFLNSQNPHESIFQRIPLLKYIVFSPVSFMYNGHFAVMGFFIVSGYVLSYRYFLSGERTHIVSALLRRYFRLTIPIFFACALAYGCLALGLFFNQDTARITNSTWIGSFYTFDPSFVQMVKFALYGVYFDFHGYQDYNNPLWVMHMVLVGSGLVFALLFLCSVTKRRYLLYLAALALLHKTYYLGFVAGVILCDAYTGDSRPPSWLTGRACLCLLLLLGVSLGSYRFTAFGIYGWLGNRVMIDYFDGMLGVFYHTVGAFFVVYVLLNSRIMQALFSSNMVTYLGSISFSVYIIHFIIICSLSCFLFNVLYAMMQMKALSVAVTGMVTVVVTVGASHLFYSAIERKSDHCIRRIYQAAASYCKALM